MNNKHNGKTRVELNRQEVEAVQCLVMDRLKGEINSKLKDATLGVLFGKVARANERLDNPKK